MLSPGNDSWYEIYPESEPFRLNESEVENGRSEIWQTKNPDKESGEGVFSPTLSSPAQFSNHVKIHRKNIPEVE